MSWSTTELQRHRKAAIEAAISENKRRLENAKFYRAASNLSARASEQWQRCIDDLKSDIIGLERQL
jgi:hypothetical protein